MKRQLARAATVLLLAGALTGAGATGAQALPGWELAGIYNWPDQCAGIGANGVQTGSWDDYFCETIVPTNWWQPGTYKLWVR